MIITAVAWRPRPAGCPSCRPRRLRLGRWRWPCLPPSFGGKERRLVAIHMSEANLGGWILAGDAMAEQLPRRPIIALGPAGYIPWKTGFKAYDFYGLVDPDIAHQEMEFTHGYAGHEKHDGALVVDAVPTTS